MFAVHFKTIIMTAREKLIQVMNQKNWAEGLMQADSARSLKRNVVNNTNIRDDKIRNTLIALGYKPKIEEQW